LLLRDDAPGTPTAGCSERYVVNQPVGRLAAEAASVSDFARLLQLMTGRRRRGGRRLGLTPGAGSGAGADRTLVCRLRLEMLRQADIAQAGGIRHQRARSAVEILGSSRIDSRPATIRRRPCPGQVLSRASGVGLPHHAIDPRHEPSIRRIAR